jgi:hypothetical protein
MRVQSSRAFRSVLAVGAIGALALVTTAPGAVAGDEGGAAPLTVTKTVSGPVPAGTTFTATIECVDGAEFDGGGTTRAVTFDAAGQPTGQDTFTFSDGPGVCTVTETAAGGAASTTYACEGSIPDEPIKDSEFSASQVEPIDVVCETTGPGPITVNIIDEGQEALVSIHNTFTDPAPQPAAQVVAQPAFTG